MQVHLHIHLNRHEPEKRGWQRLAVLAAVGTLLLSGLSWLGLTPSEPRPTSIHVTIVQPNVTHPEQPDLARNRHPAPTKSAREASHRSADEDRRVRPRSPTTVTELCAYESMKAIAFTFDVLVEF